MAGSCAALDFIFTPSARHLKALGLTPQSGVYIPNVETKCRANWENIEMSHLSAPRGTSWVVAGDQSGPKEGGGREDHRGAQSRRRNSCGRVVNPAGCVTVIAHVPPPMSLEISRFPRPVMRSSLRISTHCDDACTQRTPLPFEVFGWWCPRNSCHMLSRPVLEDEHDWCACEAHALSKRWIYDLWVVTRATLLDFPFRRTLSAGKWFV